MAKVKLHFRHSEQLLSAACLPMAPLSFTPLPFADFSLVHDHLTMYFDIFSDDYIGLHCIIQVFCDPRLSDFISTPSANNTAVYAR